MQPLSATECISPAIARTRLVLFTPFRKGRTWKLCATSYLALCGQMFFPFPVIYLAYLPLVRNVGLWAVYALVAAVLLFSALYLYVFYLCSRIKFAYFDIVVNRGEFVAPPWHRYGQQAFAWTGFKVLFGCIVTLAVSAPLAAYTRQIMPLFLSMRPGQQPPAQMIAAIFAGEGILFLFFSAFALVSGLLGDFIVPSLALEDTGLKEAFRRMFQLMAAEPGEFALYALLKTVLGASVYLCAIIAFEIALFLVILVVGLVLGLIGFALHLAGVPTIILFILGGIIAFVLEIVLVFYAMLLVIGPVFTFLDAYALYFLGGRYPLLGDLLDRSTPPPAQFFPPAYPPPGFPPPESPLPPAPAI